jgi:hypothetical protein
MSDGKLKSNFARSLAKYCHFELIESFAYWILVSASSTIEPCDWIDAITFASDESCLEVGRLANFKGILAKTSCNS